MIKLNLLKPYLYLGGIVAICLGVGYVYTLPEKFRNEGEQRNEARHAEATRIAKIERKAEIDRLKHEQAETNRKVVTQYETQLKSLSYRLADAKRVGLRVPKTICSGIASTTEATSTEGNNEAADFRLPEWLTNNLYEYANRAEEIKLQLGACQSWITQNGFYSSGQTSAPTQQD